MGPMVELGELDQQKVDKRFRVLPGNPKKRKRFFSPFLYMEENGYPAKMIKHV